MFEQLRAFVDQESLEGFRDRWQAFVLAMHDIPVEHDGEALDVEHDKIADLQLEADRVSRKESDAHAGDHSLLDRLRTLDLHRNLRMLESTRESLLHRVPSVRTALAHDERLIGQLNPGLGDVERKALTLWVSGSIEGQTMFVGFQRPQADLLPAIETLAVHSIITLVKSITNEEIRRSLPSPTKEEETEAPEKAAKARPGAKRSAIGKAST